jgi:hypothetical protein
MSNNLFLHHVKIKKLGMVTPHNLRVYSNQCCFDASVVEAEHNATDDDTARHTPEDSIPQAADCMLSNMPITDVWSAVMK